MKENVVSENKRTRNGEIDLLRFLLSIAVLLYHFGKILPKKLAPHGDIAVEFFFVVAGLFMAKHAKKQLAGGRLDSIGSTTWKYVIYRAKSFYSYYIVAMILSVIVWRILTQGMGFSGLINSLLKGIPAFSLTFLGFNGNSRGLLYVPNTWFLSALLISSFILFPCLLCKFDISTKIVFPLVSMGVLGFIYAENKTIILPWEQWSGFIYNGVLRAIAEMALGASLFALVECIQNKTIKQTRTQKTILTLSKWICFGVVFFYAFSSSLKTDFSIHALLFCCGGVVLSLSGITYIVHSNKVSCYLGKCALPIFLFHGFTENIYEQMVADGRLSLTPVVFLIILIVTVVGSVLLMHGTDIIVKLLTSRKHKIL